MALSLVAGPIGVGCTDSEQAWWGNIRVRGVGDAPVLGGLASAAMGTGGWDDPREPGDCIVLGTAPGAEVHAGRLVVRVGDDFELTIPRAAGGYYLSDEIPARVELLPGSRIEAEAEGYGDIPPFRVATEYPPYLADVVLPDPAAIASRAVALEVTWVPDPGGHRLGFTIDNLTSMTIACIADDERGSLTVPVELMQTFSPGLGTPLVKLTRCAIAPVGEDGLQELSLMACHTQGRKLCLDEIDTLCQCAEGEEPPCYAN